MRAAVGVLAGWRERLVRTREIARAEALHIQRDRGTLALLLTIPALQLVLFGYAVNLIPKAVPLSISRAADSEDKLLMQAIDEVGSFALVADHLPPGVAAADVAHGRARVGIEIPNLQYRDPPEANNEVVEVVVDASDPSAVRPAVLALELAVAQRAVSNLLAINALPIKVTWLYNETGRTDWAITPVLAGVIIMISMLLLGALCVVREREAGTWEGLLLTPVSAFEVIIGKLCPYVMVAMLQGATVIVLAHVLFALPLRGAVVALIAASAVYAAAHVVFGFVLSALARSQVQAVQLAVFFYLPAMLLSGFMFPFDGMPRWAQCLGEAFPLTHFARAARGALLRGETASEVWAHFIPVVGFLVVASIAARLVYRQRLE